MHPYFSDNYMFADPVSWVISNAWTLIINNTIIFKSILFIFLFSQKNLAPLKFIFGLYSYDQCHCPSNLFQRSALLTKQLKAYYSMVSVTAPTSEDLQSVCFIFYSYDYWYYPSS